MEIANKILAIIATFLLCCAFAIFLVLIYGAIISGLNSKAVSEFDKTYLEKIDSGVLVVDYGVNCLGYENEKTTSFFIGSTEFPLSRYYYYVDDYTIVGNFVVIDKYVEYGPYVNSSIVRENRVMLPAGITIIKSRMKLLGAE
jgi:hypothetical protein